MSNSPAIYDVTPRAADVAPARGAAAPALTSEEMDVLRATVLSGATDIQLRMFAISCAHNNLDPFSKEVYGFVNREGGIELVVSIEGLRKRAEDSLQYRGQTQQQWCGTDEVWKDIWLFDKPPAAARITVHREGHESFTGVALWKEFGRPGATNWQKYPTVMLSKVAEANAIRHLFPHQTRGLLIQEEVSDAVEATHRVKNGQDQAERGREERAIDRETGEILQRSAPRTTEIDPVKEHTEGWRTYVFDQKRALGVSDKDFNALRKELGLPLLERMTVEQCKVFNEALLNLPDPNLALDTEADARNQGALPIDVPFDVAGDPGADRYTGL